MCNFYGATKFTLMYIMFIMHLKKNSQTAREKKQQKICEINDETTSVHLQKQIKHSTHHEFTYVD